MRPFLYYFAHSFINTFKKLLKTWVALFLVLMIVGGLIGFVIGSLIPDSDDPDEKEQISVTIGLGEKDEEADSEDSQNFLEKRGIDKYLFTDTIIALAAILVLVSNIANSQKAGNIFQPGDVPMLFAAPIKPQSVMLFRLLGQMGLMVLCSIGMLFYMPQLTSGAGFSIYGSLSIIFAYSLLSVLGTLIQVAFYTISSNRKRPGKSMTTYLIVFLAVLAGAFFLYRTLGSEKDLLTCACRFFGNRNTFFVPFWGWIRGFCYYALTGSVARSLIFLALFILGCACLVVFIWKMKADFYEDAIGAAEKKAELLDNAKRSANGGVMTRQKDRSDKLNREGFSHGFGASVFFFKPIYNRLRFGIFKVLSKTSIVFTLVAGVAAWLGRDIDGASPIVVPAIALIVLVFYRTLGNPLEEDTSREFFVLVPDSSFMKMWYSMFGGLVVCAIDLLLPLIVVTVLLMENPLVVLGWMLFIISVSFFGTAVGTFINVSLPQKTGSSIKAVVQMVFLYIGMFPAIIAVIVGIVLHVMLPALVIGTVVNIGLGTLFCCFTPHFLENR
ncbi:MAG: putative ABC exporter domain-containing protein [Lachnospiraceae bacterium]|nr:putative ABC exporter domain-containing protein [Clostridiales bacterium]MBR6851500.1 putative ABC exporter domain-containing protein [Lachnospiraceae bacterium]